MTDLWKTNRAPAAAAVFTSIANWSTSGLKDITWRGEKYLWSKSREFLRFVAAPKILGGTRSVAIDIKRCDASNVLANSFIFRVPRTRWSVDYCVWDYMGAFRRVHGWK